MSQVLRGLNPSRTDCAAGIPPHARQLDTVANEEKVAPFYRVTRTIKAKDHAARGGTTAACRRFAQGYPVCYSARGLWRTNDGIRAGIHPLIDQQKFSKAKLSLDNHV